MDWTISSSWLTAERNPATVEILLNPDGTLLAGAARRGASNQSQSF
jgi:hypothetical protein